MPRTYVPKRLLSDMGPERYGELLAFCSGYRGKRCRLAEIGGRMARMDRPEPRLLEEKAGLLSDVHLVERSAREAGGGGWTQALLLCVCEGVPYLALQARGVLLPTNSHAAWRRAYEDFFRRLDRAKTARDWKAVKLS